MSTFVLLTHTQWNEPPRLRHQVANLLLDHGHRVFFFERASGFFSRPDPTPRPASTGAGDAAGPMLVQTRRLMHQQLRIVPPLHWANAAVLKPQLQEFVRKHGIGTNATILNFNFDFYFLRSVFPKNRIVTIINDDFEAMGRLPYRGHLTWALSRTCRMSDDVLAVSAPLVERLSLWSKPRLFLPWSVTPYQQPTGPVSERKTLLFWGFLNRRLDLDVFERLAQYLAAERRGFKILMVGPEDGRAGAAVRERLQRHANIEWRGRSTLDELPLNEVLASLIPYRRHPETDVTYRTNKTLLLLAKGLPIMISGMPAFLRKPFIVRLDGPQGFAGAVDECVQNFDRWQPEIREFVAENSPESRLAELTSPRGA